MALKDLLSAFGPLVSGLFAVISAVIAWKLKTSTDEKLHLSSIEKEQRQERTELYTAVFSLFETAIRQILNEEKFTVAEEFTRINARIHLLAPEPIVEQYSRVAAAYDEWASLQVRTRPQTITRGDTTITLIQAPDPAARYKKPAAEAYEKLENERERLVHLMRGQLASQASAKLLALPPKSRGSRAASLHS